MCVRTLCVCTEKAAQRGGGGRGAACLFVCLFVCLFSALFSLLIQASHAQTCSCHRGASLSDATRQSRKAKYMVTEFVAVFCRI